MPGTQINTSLQRLHYFMMKASACRQPSNLSCLLCCHGEGRFHASLLFCTTNCWHTVKANEFIPIGTKIYQSPEAMLSFIWICLNLVKISLSIVNNSSSHVSVLSRTILANEG